MPDSKGAGLKNAVITRSHYTCTVQCTCTWLYIAYVHTHVFFTYSVWLHWVKYTWCNMTYMYTHVQESGWVGCDTFSSRQRQGRGKQLHVYIIGKCYMYIHVHVTFHKCKFRCYNNTPCTCVHIHPESMVRCNAIWWLQVCEMQCVHCIHKCTMYVHCVHVQCAVWKLKNGL